MYVFIQVYIKFASLAIDGDNNTFLSVLSLSLRIWEFVSLSVSWI